MIFTSFAYLIFLPLVFTLYWLLHRHRMVQNLALIAASYIFYGWVHPWFLYMLVASTVLDYSAALAMERWPTRKRLALTISLVGNLGLLGFFKYFNFFIESFAAAGHHLGLNPHVTTLRIFLPVGISFYTFQSLTYTIDVYRGQLKARRNFIDYALFVTFFPQLVAGPIERAAHLLPRIEQERRWEWAFFASAWPLLIQGFMKKIVIADNVAIIADKIFSLKAPGLLPLVTGTLAFALQIYTDFSAYTDIARGSARLLGFDLVRNFDSPYLALSPSDFWRRWHISFSSWIRDYLYIPLGGSRVRGMGHYAFVVLTTMTLSGLWHGAAWHFVAWGLYHGLLVYIYHLLGKGGRWRPATRPGTLVAWALMFMFINAGWLLFRVPSLGWLAGVLLPHHGGSHAGWGLTGDALLMSLAAGALLVLYLAPMFVLLLLERVRALRDHGWARAVVYGCALAAIIVFSREAQQDFIYFQF